MQTCECMFCYYRNQRIAAFAARDAIPDGRGPAAGPGGALPREGWTPADVAGNPPTPQCTPQSRVFL